MKLRLTMKDMETGRIFCESIIKKHGHKDRAAVFKRFREQRRYNDAIEITKTGKVERKILGGGEIEERVEIID